MKINMANATVDWLTSWIEEQRAAGSRMIYTMLADQKAAHFWYINNAVDVYISEVAVSGNQVSLYMRDLSASDLQKLMALEFDFNGTIAVFYHLDCELHYEPYDRDPSPRLELGFRPES